MHSGFSAGFPAFRTPAQFSGRQDVGCHKTNLPARLIYLLGSGNVILITQPAREWRCWPEQGLLQHPVLPSAVRCSAQGEAADPGRERTAGEGLFSAIPWKTHTETGLSLGICVYQEHGSDAVLVPEFLTDDFSPSAAPLAAAGPGLSRARPLWDEMFHLSEESNTPKLSHTVH